MFLKMTNSTSGLTNQKFAILGLLLKAKDIKAKPVIPTNLFDMVPRPHKILPKITYVPIKNLLDTKLLSKVSLVDNMENVEKYNGFRYGAKSFANPNKLTKHFLSHIKTSKYLINKVKLMDLPDVYDCIQLRVENDFLLYKNEKIKKGDWTEKTAPLTDINKIFNKIRSLGVTSPLYVCCDEADLSVSKKVLYDAAGDIKLIFKSDIFNEQLSNLELASIDFEIMQNSRAYFGLNASTMSKLSVYYRKNKKSFMYS